MGVSFIVRENWKYMEENNSKTTCLFRIDKLKCTTKHYIRKVVNAIYTLNMFYCFKHLINVIGL